MDRARDYFGVEVTDKVSGFRGTIVSVNAHINGCLQFLVKPKVGKDGTYREAQWFDEQTLKFPRKVAHGGATAGGPQPTPRLRP